MALTKVFFIFLLLAPGLFAAVSLSNLFSDNMIIQRDFESPVWGTAASGESVTVKYAGQEKSTTADAGGDWMVKLDPQEAGGPHTLEVSGTNTLTFSNVMSGDVWLGSGQSNMAYTLNQVSQTYDVNEEAVDMTDVRIRKHNGAWNEATPETAIDFSAAAFFFGRHLQRELGVPVGLMTAAAGGTNIEKWMSPGAIELDPLLDANTEILGSLPGNLYNSQIAPLIPFGLKGAIWYQGERNSKTDLTEDTRFQYAGRMQLLIEGWRSEWNQGDFSFYSVQLPDFSNNTYDLPNIREQQRLSMRTLNHGMVVTIDIGGDLHPQNKLDVGIRLADWALAHDYGMTDLVYSGPLYESMEIVDETVKLKFRHFGGGLHVSGSSLEGFEIAGADSQWTAADAVIEGDFVIVSATGITDPMYARYAWSMEPVVSLTNEDGLPASPFTTAGEQLPVGLYGCRDASVGTFDPAASIHDPLDCMAAPVDGDKDKLVRSISFSGTFLQVTQTGEFSVVLYNIQGQNVFQAVGRDEGVFELDALESGVYTGLVNSRDGDFSFKFFRR